MLRVLLLFLLWPVGGHTQSWVRINLLGYQPGSPKTAVWCSKQTEKATVFRVADSATGKTVFTGTVNPFGAYGPFAFTARLNFSPLRKTGVYYIAVGKTRSPFFRIDNNVYSGMADFSLRYMRQQRSGFNPYLNDSCHQHDGYTLYGPMPDSTYIDVAGGWHDASDYLQYASTSANAAWHLLAAYRDFPTAFSDQHQYNGLNGSNNIPDVLDEARWGIDWLLKMHPQQNWMFHQLGDDRDHISMRMPGLDSQYGKGYQRPVYFLTGQPQGTGKYKNRSTGTASTAAKFSSAFALGAQLFSGTDSFYSGILYTKAFSAFNYALQKPGYSQTAPNRAPYFYEEENWMDDMGLAAISIRNMVNTAKNGYENGYYRNESFKYNVQEGITPWLGKDTAKHYQWYPFTNTAQMELAATVLQNDHKITPEHHEQKNTMATLLHEGIARVWEKAQKNAFYRGVPFTWCSNNLQTSFSIQCYRYRQITGNARFEELEQAGFDWLLGCNPWGTSMVYGLPAHADNPADPHSAFTHIKKYPIDGGLVDGPVYTSIFNNLIGLTLYEPDEYAEFQSGLAVYHDDYGDYSTNEPTMDGTAAFIYLAAAKETGYRLEEPVRHRGAVIRGPQHEKKIALVFTGDEFADGGTYIVSELKKLGIKASFFLTGRFYRNPAFKTIIEQIKKQGHYLGPHSNNHLLYCDWNNRDSLLVTRAQFTADLQQNVAAMRLFGIQPQQRWFIPPYEWYNDTVAAWASAAGWPLVNYTPGTITAADYTWPELKNYRSSQAIRESVLQTEKEN
ncbi:MAG: glycoside hydrolase family 9 protein, partial [Dinghuibacter sp.]|nr:glycoside hydrolase family 9 protein [Dinghuibacter sp.]